MNVEFKYALNDTVVYKESVYDSEGFCLGFKESKGRIFQAEICGGMNLFGLKDQKPYIQYKIQKGDGWEHVNENMILRRK